ncbi:hypothetical protein ACLOJK_036990 [Asimina triloba]
MQFDMFMLLDVRLPFGYAADQELIGSRCHRLIVGHSSPFKLLVLGGFLFATVEVAHTNHDRTWFGAAATFDLHVRWLEAYYCPCH